MDERTPTGGPRLPSARDAAAVRPPEPAAGGGPTAAPAGAAAAPACTAATAGAAAGPAGREPGAAGSLADVLGGYLTGQAAAFLRTLGGPGGPEAGTMLPVLEGIGAALRVFAPLLDLAWGESLRTEVAWLRGVSGLEAGYARRLARLGGAMDALTAPEAAPVPGGEAALPPGTAGAGAGTEAEPAPAARAGSGLLAGHPGAAKARALVERQLAVARSRAHSTVLQELGSARFHALADALTLLASDVPFAVPPETDAAAALLPCLAAARHTLSAAVHELPISRSGLAYNGDGLRRLGRAAAPSAGASAAGTSSTGESAAEGDSPAALEADDLPWRRARMRAWDLRRTAEACAPFAALLTPALRALAALTTALDLDREAAEAAATAASAARTPRITPATGYVLGVLQADQRLEVEAARYAFTRHWADHERCGTWEDWDQWVEPWPTSR